MSFKFELGQMVFIERLGIEEPVKLEARVEYLDEPNAYLIKTDGDWAWITEDELTPASV